ncbi:MAG: T9SS type A sorting domain-containing protein, partial [Ginsengibacter sp.]
SDVTITLPVNAVNLSGAGMDADGRITGYQWKQISGPAGATISSPNTALTSVNDLTGGTYEFEFTVTDNNGAKGKDTMILVVALGRLSTQESNSLMVYPNPVRDIATVEINTPKLNTDLVLTVTAMSGRVIYKKVLKSIGNTVTEKINMVNFAQGTYMVTAIFNKVDKQTFKIIKL